MADIATPPQVPAIDKPPRRKRWIPLSLRLFVAILAVLAIGQCLLIYRYEALIANIKREGGMVGRVPIAPNWLRQWPATQWIMQRYDRVNQVTLDRTPITGTVLNSLVKLTEIRFLFLNDTDICDAELAKLARLTMLWSLSLDNTQVTDAGLQDVSRIDELVILSVKNTNVTDAGLIHLSKLTNFQVLHLDGTQVTDAGVIHLSGLRKLAELSLRNTRVTDAGVAELRRAMPGLRIVR